MTLNRLKMFLNLMESYIKSYNEATDKGYFLDVDIQYPDNLHNLYIDLPFLPERIKI